jgi:hypothetical protein
LSSTQSFLSLPNPSSAAGNIQITGATILDHDTYQETLTATVDGKTATANFDIVIKDPCSTAVFETSPTGLVNMTVILPSFAI